MERASGVLAHVTSLPGGHGIGDLGPPAFAWIDLLKRAKQKWWQFLPLGPTGYADSPYQCFSAFAGNPNLISLERLVQDGLLTTADLPGNHFPAAEVDYDRVTPLKLTATERAFQRFKAGAAQNLADDFQSFCKQESAWLNEFALFAALKERHGGSAWWDWPTRDRCYDPSMAARPSTELRDAIELCKFRQFLFFRQWHQLRQHAHAAGIQLIGDMPIFISSDSVDVWSRPDLFLLDDQRRPSFVAGVPPDYFSETGQLWGNPLYDWQRHKETGFAWWIDRMRSTLKLVDLVRLDHFRGFEAYWAVPANEKTAENGSWEPGPGSDLFQALQMALSHLPLIAEDLGVITPPVNELRFEFRLPGMRVLQFAFGGAQEDRFFPHNYHNPTIVYTGTHDNETTVGWFQNLTSREVAFLDSYSPGASADPAWALIRLAWASIADLAIAPLQDVLRLGNEARMNLPGRTHGNWRWRAESHLLTSDLFDQLGELTTIYQRGSHKEMPSEDAGGKQSSHEKPATRAAKISAS
jgi:4-alpha-glucanotransferase